jgi:hypothetical protein
MYAERADHQRKSGIIACVENHFTRHVTRYRSQPGSPSATVRWYVSFRSSTASVFNFLKTSRFTRLATWMRQRCNKVDVLDVPKATSYEAACAWKWGVFLRLPWTLARKLPSTFAGGAVPDTAAI